MRLDRDDYHIRSTASAFAALLLMCAHLLFQTCIGMTGTDASIMTKGLLFTLATACLCSGSFAFICVYQFTKGLRENKYV